MSLPTQTLRPIGAGDGPALRHLIDPDRARPGVFFAGTVARTRSWSDTGKHVVNMLGRAEVRIY